MHLKFDHLLYILITVCTLVTGFRINYGITHSVRYNNGTVIFKSSFVFQIYLLKNILQVVKVIQYLADKYGGFL